MINYLQLKVKSALWLTAVLNLCVFTNAFSQMQPDAGNWKTWVLQNTNDLNVPPPPGVGDTKNELAALKNMMKKVDAVKRQDIIYWDAGAPSYRWNEIGYKLTGPELTRKKYGGNFWRAPMAWMNMAIYDATIATWKIKYIHNRKRPYEADKSIMSAARISKSPSYPSEHAATAAAAATVLAYFFPELGDSLMTLAKNAAQSRVYAGDQFQSDVDAGWMVGEKVASMIIEQAQNDGSSVSWTGNIPNDPMLWKGEYPVGAAASTFKPIVLKSGNQFRPPAPPQFESEMKELKNFKQNFFTIYQSYYWAAHDGLDLWTDYASLKMFENHLDDNAPACSRIYALLHVTFHDAIISITDAKYAYWGIRPFQYDTTYRPLIGFTPPFPGYPSGHAAASSAASTVLSYFFPEKAAYYNKCAVECADSRFYAGIHFPSDNKAGLELGASVAGYIIDSWAKKDGAEKLDQHARTMR